MAERPKPIVPLLAWQQQWIEDETRFKFAVAAAQAAGKSFISSLEMALDRLKEGSLSAQLGILLSASERQSVELMEKVKMHTRAWDVRFEDGYFENTDIAEHRTIFPNGKRLIALPANPDTARGYSGDMLLDEFALHRDPKAIWAAAMTRITRGFKVRVCSTLKGLNNKFGEMAKMLGLASGTAPEHQPVVREGWHGYWVDIYMAVRQGSPVDPEAMRRALQDDTIFLQDYCNVPMDDGSDYIPLEMILACESGEASLDWDGQFRFGLCAGFDVGRKRDLSVIVIGEPVGPLAIVRGVIWMPHMKFADQKKICHEVAQVIEVGGGRFAMDATGIGMQMGEELQAEFSCVEPVNFATAVESGAKDDKGKPIKQLVKERMAGVLKRRFEDRMIWIPESVVLRRSMQAVKRFISPTGAVRLDAQRSEGGHADEFWATALMCGAMEGSRRPYIPASEGGLVGQTVLGNVMEVEF
jgi:phage FluMu gp28-like protein